MRELSLAELLHEVNLFGVAVEVHPIAANLLLNLLRYLETDGHNLLPGSREGAENLMSPQFRSCLSPNQGEKKPIEASSGVIRPIMSPMQRCTGSSSSEIS